MKKIIYILALFPLMFVSCANFLDMVPEDDIQTVETIFEKNAQAQEWFRKCYTYLNTMLPDYYANPALLGTDEFIMGEYRRSTNDYSGLRITEGQQTSFDPIGNIWAANSFWEAIRYINIFLERVDGVYDMMEADRRMMKAEITVLKAHIYFEFFRRYGPFVIVDKNLEITNSDEEMQLPRNTVDECVAEIVRLIELAEPNLFHLQTKDVSRRTFHSLESALMLKAQTLFYAASPLFNGNVSYLNFKNRNGVNLFSAVEDNEKWKIASNAIEEAIAACDKGEIVLISNFESRGTDFLTTMFDIENTVLAVGYSNKEAIHYVRPALQTAGQGSILRDQLPSIALPEGESTHELYDINNLGILSPTMKMVEMYYTNDGLPLNADKDWNEGYDKRWKPGVLTKNATYKDVVPENIEVLQLHLDREPRFYASIATDRTYWQRGTKNSENILVNAYRGELFGTIYDVIDKGKAQNLSGYWIKKFLSSKISTGNYTGEMSGIGESGHIIMRKAELYLMLAEARNEYLPVPDETVYAPLNKVRKRAGIPDVVTSWEEYSNNATAVSSKGGMRNIIRQEWNIEFAFEGIRFWNLRRWKTAANELNANLYGWNILGTDAKSFYNNYEGPIVVWTKNKEGFSSPRDYFFPIKGEEIYISGVVQNFGW